MAVGDRDLAAVTVRGLLVQLGDRGHDDFAATDIILGGLAIKASPVSLTPGQRVDGVVAGSGGRSDDSGQQPPNQAPDRGLDA